MLLSEQCLVMVRMMITQLFGKPDEQAEAEGLPVTVLDDGTRIVKFSDIRRNMSDDQKKSLRAFGDKIRKSQQK